MMAGTDGRDTDGAGSPGIVEEQSRFARAGETDTTRFGMSEGTDTDGSGSPGIVGEQAGAGERPAVAFEHSAGHDTDGAGSGGILDEEPVDLDERAPRDPSTALDEGDVQ